MLSFSEEGLGFYKENRFVLQGGFITARDYGGFIIAWKCRSWGDPQQAMISFELARKS